MFKTQIKKKKIRVPKYLEIIRDFYTNNLYNAGIFLQYIFIYYF